MARRFCRDCALEFPLAADYVECPVCGDPTATSTNDPADDWQVKVEVALAKHLTPEQRRLILWRRRSFVAAGFAGATLDMLVESPVSPHDAADLVERGCAPELAARILL